MRITSALAWSSLTLRRQRIAVGALVFVCIFCLSNISRSSNGSPSFRRNLTPDVESKAVEESYTSAMDSQSYPSYLVPPQPSEVPRHRVFTSIGSDNKPESLALLTNCAITSQVRVVATSPKWILQSIDEFGSEKTVGGDEFYVTYTDNNKNHRGIFKSDKPTAVALVRDLQDGTYELDFVTTPIEPNPESLSGDGFLRVWFQYSCGIGFMAQPEKLAWHSGGSSSFYHKLDGIPQPPIRTFQQPHLQDICFHDFEKVYGVGDSVLSLFVINKHATLPNMVLHTMFGALGSQTMRSKIQFVEAEVGKDLRHDRMALLVGSSTWDILMDTHQNDPYFEDHLKAVRRYVTELKLRHPNVTILWKSPNTLHVHRSTCSKEAGDACLRRIKYMSASRSEYLYTEQKKIMDEMGIPFLDLYEAYSLSAEWTYEHDGRHYHRQLTSRMLKWFNDCKIAYAHDAIEG